MNNIDEKMKHNENNFQISTKGGKFVIEQDFTAGAAQV